MGEKKTQQVDTLGPPVWHLPPCDLGEKIPKVMRAHLVWVTKLVGSNQKTIHQKKRGENNEVGMFGIWKILNCCRKIGIQQFFAVCASLTGFLLDELSFFYKSHFFPPWLFQEIWRVQSSMSVHIRLTFWGTCITNLRPAFLSSVQWKLLDGFVSWMDWLFFWTFGLHMYFWICTGSKSPNIITCTFGNLM